MINMEVYEIKKSGACGSGGACSEHKTQAQNKININRGARLSIVEVYEVKTGVQRLRKRGCAETKMGCAVEVRRVWMEVCRVKTEIE